MTIVKEAIMIMMKEINLYKGYEPYSEITLIEMDGDGQKIYLLKLWYTHFELVCAAVHPSQKEGVMYYFYNNVPCWDDVDIWECKDSELFYKQILKDVNVEMLDQILQNVRIEMLKILESCTLSGNKLYFVYG